jgi:murein DD-endopeptidase MepM/ murein hydrolase activator NlpD
MAPVVASYVTSGWADPREYRDGVHEGLDFRATPGAVVRAVASGTVVRADSVDDSAAGIWCAIDHGGIMSRYMHLSQLNVTKGQKVSKGDVIGYSGATGIARSKPHLHFDLRVADSKISEYVAATGIRDAVSHPMSEWSNGTGGFAVPSEPIIPVDTYAPAVLANAKKRGIPIGVAITAGIGMIVAVAGIGVLLWLLLRKPSRDA